MQINNNSSTIGFKSLIHVDFPKSMESAQRRVLAEQIDNMATAFMPMGVGPIEKLDSFEFLTRGDVPEGSVSRLLSEKDHTAKAVGILESFGLEKKKDFTVREETPDEKLIPAREFWT